MQLHTVLKAPSVSTTSLVSHFALCAVIATKGRESDYDGVKKDASRMCTELNILIQKAQLVIPANAAAGGGYGFGR